jgi:hypothetical protein
MSVILTVNNIDFEVPTQGSQAPWAEGLDGWHEEVTKVLKTLYGQGDILETGCAITNNAADQKVYKLVFDPLTVRSFAVRGSITRPASSGYKYEEFVLVGLNEGDGWALQQDGIGNAGITFTIANNGQIFYTSTDLSTSSPGVMKYRGIGILQKLEN